MSNYPNKYDDDTSLPRVDDNIVEIGSLAINQLRSAVFIIERELGLNISGSSGSLAARIALCINPDGTLKPAAIVAAGAIVGPVTDLEVSPTAAIAESKLALAHNTTSLFTDLNLTKNDLINLTDLFSELSTDFVRHLSGVASISIPTINGRHVVSHIDINSEPSDSRDPNFGWPGGESPKNRFGQSRGSNLALFLRSLNQELLRHFRADGLVHTDGYADTISHPARSVSLDSSGFFIIPKTIKDVQEFAESIDKTNFLSINNHQQNHHANGISRTCRGVILNTDGYGAAVPFTPVKTYLRHANVSSIVDDNNVGDDIIEFIPGNDAVFKFDSEFGKVKPGYIITVDYGDLKVQYLIDSIRFTYDGAVPPNRKYIVRIAGRNIRESALAIARIDKPLFSENKSGVLALSAVNNQFNQNGSLLLGHPKAAMCLGLGFDPNNFGPSNYNLYLAIYPYGDPVTKTINLPPIDVTGNLGATPGKYTLDSIVQSTNDALHRAGFNYRFIAFQSSGEFGIMMSDSILNAGFSIISGVVNNIGVLVGTLVNNVIGDASNNLDPLGLGRSNANVASASYRSGFITIEQSQTSANIFVPLNAKNYYVDGIERSSLRQVSDGYVDTFKDGYWLATISEKNIFPSQTVRVKYEIPLDLSKAELIPGKTLLVQPVTPSTTINDFDYGRFIIENVTFDACDGVVNKTIIEVYNGVHAAGNPVAATSLGIKVRIYFGDESVSFDKLNVINSTSTDLFKRYFEIYVDSATHTFTHERARFNRNTTNVSLATANIIKVSSKLRGYDSALNKKITLFIQSYNQTDGTYTGYLCRDSINNLGPAITGKRGTVTRFYDETNVDHIDILFDFNTIPVSFTNESLVIDLFPSLIQDLEVFFLGSCQLDDPTKKVSYIRDVRQFGNVSEKELTTSALDLISSGDRHLHQNGVVRGFDQVSVAGNQLSFTGGLALVNGRLLEQNHFKIGIPIVQEYISGSPYNKILWAVCVDDRGDIRTLPLTDYDSTISLSNNPTREVTLFNPVNSSTYTVESTTFQKIAIARKDLTLLYLVVSDVTNATTFSLTVSDARKFARDSSANIPIVWTSNQINGNFNTLTGLNNWLRYNTTHNNIVRLKGIFTLTSPISLAYDYPVKFEGDGAIFRCTPAVGASSIQLGSNVTLDGIRLEYTPATADSSYTSTNLVNSNAGVIDCLAGSVTAPVTNVTIQNCEFVISSVDHYAALNFRYPSSGGAFQNVILQNNRFSCTATGEVKRAVIAVTGNTTSGATTCYAVNFVIKENICDRNQLISFSSTANGNNIRGIIAIKCKIQDNICGAINILTRQDTPLSTVNGTVIRDKENMLFVDQNTCRFIYSGAGTGLVYQGGVRPNVNFPTGVFSGSWIIQNNTCSWIHLGIRTPTDPTVQVPSVVIRNNRITAYNVTFINQHYYGSSTINTALIVDRTSGT